MSEKTIDVFISYSSKDQKIADELVKAIEKRGPKCWIASRDIPQGCLWADEIDMAISKAKVFLVVVGENSISSTQVPKEIGLAISSCEYIIPYRIDKSELKGAFRYYLSDCQWVDGFGQKSNDVNTLAESIVATIGKKEEQPEEKDGAEEVTTTTTSTTVQVNKKWFITGICAVVCLCLLVVGIFVVLLSKGGNKQDTDPVADVSAGNVEEDLGQTLVVLRASDEISVYDLLDAIEVVKGRLDFYFGENNYVLESYDNDTIIQLLLPNEALTECELGDLLFGYLIRPIKLYFLSEKEFKDEKDNSIYIESGAIEDVELCTGRISDWDLSEEGEQFSGDYEYLKLTLSDDVASRMKELYTPEENFVLARDLDSDNNIYYCKYISVLDDGKTLLFLPSNGSHKINELLKYVLQHETFNRAFSVTYNEAVVWEKDGFVNKQCSYDAFEGEVAVGVYGVMDEYTATAGTFSDYEQMLHDRMKILDIPYAVGHLANDPMSLVFACNPEKITEDIWRWLPYGNLTYVYAKDSVCGVNGTNNIWNTEKQDDGSYIVRISWKDITEDYYEEKFRFLQESAEGNGVTLSVDGVTVLIGEMDGEEVVFNRTIYDDVSSEKVGIDEKYFTLLELWRDGFNYTNKNRTIYKMRRKKICLHDIENYRELYASNEPVYGIRETIYSAKRDNLVDAFSREFNVSCTAKVNSGNVYVDLYIPKDVYSADMLYQIIDYTHNQEVLQEIAPLANTMYLTLRSGEKAYLRMIYNRKDVDYFGTVIWTPEDDIYAQTATDYVKKHYKEYDVLEISRAY